MVRVTPGTPRPAGSTVSVDVGNAGTVMRFLPAVAALTPADVAFDGDPRARERPVGALLSALRTLGVSIDDGGRGALPFTIHGAGAVPGGPVTLDASGSSQLVSGLLLAAPRFTAGVAVQHAGPPVPSLPHIEMTVRMLRDAGATVEAGAGQRRPARTPGGCEPGPLNLGDFTVEPDLSNAGPFLAAALVTGGSVTIRDWPADVAAARRRDPRRDHPDGRRRSRRGPDGADRHRVGRDQRHRGRPARHPRDVPAAHLGRRARLRARPRSPGSGTPGRRRPTGWPRSPRRSTRSAAT